jgi:hypothetical protein
MPNPVNNINVSLVNGQLDVEDHGGISVNANADATNITWHLTGVLTQGNFQPVTPPGVANPGFSWKQAPPSGYFGDPSIGNNGNSLSITDNHLGSGTDGQWTYNLRVLYQGTIYCTESSAGIGATLHDPIIINR